MVSGIKAAAMCDLIKGAVLLVTLPIWLPIMIMLLFMALIVLSAIIFIGLGVMVLLVAGIAQFIIAYT